MLKDAKEISKAFELIFTACNNIKDHGGCEECTLRFLCLDDGETSVLDLGDLVSASTWDEWLNYADNVTFSKSDLDAQDADFRRKLDIEERMIGE